MVDIAKNIQEMGQVISDSVAMTDPAKGVANLQLAGNISVEVTGPAIDAFSGSNPKVMQLTQLAWQKNGELAGATSMDTAKAAFQQITNWYSQAYQMAQSMHQTPITNSPAYHAPPANTPIYNTSAVVNANASPGSFPIVPTIAAVAAGVIGFTFGGFVGAGVAAALGYGVATELKK
jgi:hypothetical protein